jgi:signal transduction histidine kinase
MQIVSELNTQVNKQKADLEKTLFDLESSAQEKDRILRTVAHDLRNPLGGIASLTSAMVEDADYNNEQIELLRIIKETAFDSLELINEILEATNSTPAELQKQPVEINSLLSNSVELLRFKAAEKNQKIILRTLDLPEQLLISREKIWRVISNLISNAIKFSPVGAEIRVSITDENRAIQIAVNDKGIGIPENIKSKVFNMFTDAKRPGTLGEKSFGLGLSICRQIIEKHHGEIWFESDKETGTTFYVRLSKTVIPVSNTVVAAKNAETEL